MSAGPSRHRPNGRTRAVLTWNLRLGSARWVLLAALVFVVGVGLGGSSWAMAEEPVFTDITPPKISGDAVEGEELTLTHGVWSASTTSYADQWLRCNKVGKDCASISKETRQTYRLTAADVGFTIRVGESAKNSAGAVTPAESEPTAVVQARAGSQGGETGSGGGSQGGGPPSGGGAPTHTSKAALASLLARQLIPAGKSRSISALLRHGGLRISFKLPTAGTLEVRWYLLPAVSGHRKTRARTPILVATGGVRLSANRRAALEIKLTKHGRQLLAHARSARVEAKATFAPSGQAKVDATKSFTLTR